MNSSSLFMYLNEKPKKKFHSDRSRPRQGRGLAQLIINCKLVSAFVPRHAVPTSIKDENKERKKKSRLWLRFDSISRAWHVVSAIKTIQHEEIQSSARFSLSHPFRAIDFAPRSCSMIKFNKFSSLSEAPHLTPSLDNRLRNKLS